MKKLNSNSPTLTMEEAFENFLFAKSAQGVTEKTIKSYKSHFHCISKHLDTSIELSSLKKQSIHKMIASMRASNLSQNTIASYVRVLKAFLRWARDEGLCDIAISAYKTEETVKEGCQLYLQVLLHTYAFTLLLLYNKHLLTMPL
jgi:site-specific recombinase XerD